MKKILFVCTGNTCRSPMAEGIFNRRAEESGLSARAFSCGIMAKEGMPVSNYAIMAAADYGADLNGHISKPVTEEILRESDKIYCMTPSHTELLLHNYPEYAVKTATISPEGISDPFSGDVDNYKHAAAMINAAVSRLLAEMNTSE